MKKAYTKPYLVMEAFQLDAAIAASCSSEGKTALGFYQSSCTLEEEAPGLGYFGAACDVNVTDPDFNNPNDTLCYHGPTDPGSLFMAS